MNIQYLEPLTRAFERMKIALFKPFDLGKWFVVGFTAWLALLTDGNSGGNNSGWKNEYNSGDFSEILHAPYEFWQWVTSNPLWSFLIGLGIVVVLGIIIVLTWVSSRGKFMFLDNVVHDRALVTQPWNEYQRLGDSLFGWRVVFTLVLALILGGFLFYVWQGMAERYFDTQFGDVPVLFIVEMTIIFSLMVLVVLYISMLLDNFVVPLMYKHDIGVMDAWRRFLDLHWSHVGTFILYGFVKLLIGLAILIIIFSAGLLTCCLGFLLIAIPYIGTVLLLPVHWTLRDFSIQFLRQFGDDFRISTDQ